jgi:heme-degrading monooxygenase HmoA
MTIDSEVQAMIVTIFRSRLRDEGREDYFALAPKMSAQARSMPGYLSHKVFVAEDGERVTIVEFADEASQRAWAMQMDHVAAKQQGRASFYTEYSLQVCSVVRESKFAAKG